jgi:hypothetical protein
MIAFVGLCCDYVACTSFPLPRISFDYPKWQVQAGQL